MDGLDDGETIASDLLDVGGIPLDELLESQNPHLLAAIERMVADVRRDQATEVCVCESLWVDGYL